MREPETEDSFTPPTPLTALEGPGVWWRRVQQWASRLGRTPKLGLALGSGASWGIAHTGILSVVKEMNVPVSYLSGCSAGSLVGALYAAGIEGEALVKLGTKFGWKNMGNLNVIPKMSLAHHRRLALYLKTHIGNPTFEDLRLPFYVVATNLKTGRLRVFDKGPVIPAVQASCSIPGIFPPVEIEGDLYCDGGLLEKVPCRVLKEAGADLVIGVELARSNHPQNPGNIFEVIKRAIDIALLEQVRINLLSANLVIRPNVDDIYEFAFDRNDTLIQRGMEAAQKELRQWAELEKVSVPARVQSAE